ncbi:MAG TPA: hybrid sensor histidine kinase/response regulator [bacterium]|nr:hybrid sensor histidine kinase/response regulator [bacterium]
MNTRFDRSTFIQKFVLETRENIRRLNNALLRIEKNPGDTDAPDEILRTLHTIKGSARMLNLRAISELMHAFEEAFGNAHKQKYMHERAVMDTFLRTLDKTDTHLDDIVRDGHSEADLSSWLHRITLIAERKINELQKEASADTSDKKITETTEPVAEPVTPKKSSKTVTLDRGLFIKRFLTEAEEHVRNLKQHTAAWQKQHDAASLEIAIRAAHTLKGSARMMKFENVGNISQRAEFFFRGLKEKKLTWSAGADQVLVMAYQSLDDLIEKIRITEKDEFQNAALMDMLDEINAGAVPTEETIRDLIRKPAHPVGETRPVREVKSGASGPDRLGERLIEAGLITREELMHANQTTDTRMPLGERLVALGYINRDQLNQLLMEQKSSRELLGQTQINAGRITQKEEVLNSDQFVHVRIDKLDELIKSVGDISTKQIKTEEHIAVLRKIYLALKYWNSELRDYENAAQAGNVIDNPHLSQRLSETADELADVIKIAREEAANFDLSLNAIQTGIMGMRMVPIRSIFDGFPRAVRDLAKNLGKDVKLVVEGAETELDRKIVESLNEPLIHLIRNAIDHGLEPSPDRIAAGKTAEGLLRIAAYNEGNTILIEVEDDGRGIDLERIKAKAIEKKIVTDEQDISRFSENDLINLIFLPAFSTSELITDISGRGYGMDVVKRAIESIKGYIEVVTAPNVGTRFSIHLPLTLTSLRALFVKSAAYKFAVPMQAVAETLKIKHDDIIEVVEKKAIRLRNQLIPIVRLNEVVGYAASDEERDERFLIIIHANGEKAGFVVDDIIDEREILVKSLPKQFAKVKHISSATVASNNEIIMVLHAPDLIRATKDFSVREQVQSIPKSARSILVVDDSLNTREIEKTILQAYGYDVETAKDGLDALEKIQQKKYDLVVTDLEMPAMDGLTLTSRIKSEASYQHIPVVIVTSRDSAEDKRRGIEAGANAYIVKGSFDQTNLIDTVESLIG